MYQKGVRLSWRSGNEIQEDFFGAGDPELGDKSIECCA